MNTKLLNTPIYIWLAFFLSIPLFKFYPEIDLYLSSLFYKNNTFFLQDTLFESFFHDSIRPVIISAFLVPLGIYLYNLYYKKNLFTLTKRKLIYILLVLSLAPGAIVQYGFKNQFERPRPRHVVEFGGTKKFYPAYTVAHENGKSFSSGHVAAAFSLLGVAMLARKRRKFWITLVMLYGTGMMVARMAAGGHFFSDVMTSFFIVYIATNVLYKYMIENQEEKPI